MMILLGLHFYHLKMLCKAQEAVEKLTGKKPDGKRCRRAAVNFEQPAQQVQQPIAVVSPSPVTSAPVIEYSIFHAEERDKDMGPIIAGDDRVAHQMV